MPDLITVGGALGAGVVTLAVGFKDAIIASFPALRERVLSYQSQAQFLTEQIKTHAELERKLNEKWASANDLERARIDGDLERVRGQQRQLTVYQQAVAYLPAQSDDQSGNPSTEKEGAKISPHWVDKFNEFARAHNEDWRQNLLAKALAKEAAEPGSIPPRAVWLIGTMEEQMHYAFARFLDVAFVVGTTPLLPDAEDLRSEEIGGQTVGNLILLLCEVGLLAESNSTRSFPRGEPIPARYGDEMLTIHFPVGGPMDFPGLVLSTVGLAIWGFYPRFPNEIGRRHFHRWLQAIQLGGLRKVEQVPSETVQTRGDVNTMSFDSLVSAKKQEPVWL